MTPLRPLLWLALALPLTLPAQDRGAPAESAWFPWPALEPIPGSALDLTNLNERPAGAHGFIEVRDGHFATSQGQRLRFWGCNLSSGENFPDEATATRLARRLAQGGINIVRLHHLDNSWSVDSAGSLWTPGSKDRIRIDPQQLDKLHRLVAALKAEGIYVDLNLKVSRTLGEADGFPASIAQCPSFQKRVDYFDPRLVELQKDYARQLLSARNPYTGLSLAEDPAMAMVELNNENSLLGMRSREVGAGLETLPEPFRGELVARWNQWLAARYPDRDALAKVWQTGATPCGGDLWRTTAPGWQNDAQPGNRLALDAGVDQRSLHLNLTQSDGVRWRSGAFLGELALANDETYVLRFRAKADRNRALMVAVGRDEAGWRTDKWRTLGLSTTIGLTPEWREFRLPFVSHSIVDLPARLTFMVGHSLGEVWIDGLALERGSATAGWRAPADPRQGSVPLPTDATPAQWADWLRFLSDTEVAYVRDLRQYLRNELGVRVPIVCSQANYGGIAGLLREAASDFTDTHCYWQHPDFAGPTGAWDTAHWTILNTPQLDEFGPRWFGELGGIAQLRVQGRPFTVTELDHPAPSEFACEFYPEVTTYAALQDWDGLFTFDAVEIGREPSPQAWQSFFDQRHDPAKWGRAPFAVRVFRQGLVDPLPTRRTLHVPADPLAHARHLDVLWLQTNPGADLGFLQHRLEVAPELTAAPAACTTSAPETTSTLAGMLTTPAGPVYRIAAPQAACLIGHLGGQTLTSPPLGIDCASFGRNFASLTALALDGRPLANSRHLLVSLVGRAGNPDLQWNEARTSAGSPWGHGPSVAEQVPATLRIQCAPGRVVHPLAPDGSRLAALPTRYEDGWLTFSTRDGAPSIHYEIVGTK